MKLSVIVSVVLTGVVSPGLSVGVVAYAMIRNSVASVTPVVTVVVV